MLQTFKNGAATITAMVAVLGIAGAIIWLVYAERIR